MCGATYGFQQQPACRLCNLTARIVVRLYSEASVRLYVRMKTLQHGSKNPMGVIQQQYKALLPAAVPMPYISVQALKSLQCSTHVSSTRAGKERWRVGAVVPLQPTDDSPFLGNLKTAAPQLAVEVGCCPAAGWFVTLAGPSDADMNRRQQLAGAHICGQNMRPATRHIRTSGALTLLQRLQLRSASATSACCQHGTSGV